MPQTPPVLSVENLTIDYRKFRALDDLSVDIESGGIVGIIGPNGAGKTSFIKALCGRAPIKKGRIFVAGRPLKRGQNRQTLIGLVPQDIGLYAHLSAAENLNVFAKMTGLRGALSRKDAIENALAAVEMTPHARTKISHMSGGMKRRINVAAAIMHSPPVLILDEPTAGVDHPARDTVHRLARRLAGGGKAVLLITHELEQAEALCDRVLLLARGKMLAFDHPNAVLSRVYQDKREVMVRFSSPPQGQTLEALAPFKFQPAELPTIWTAMTNASEVSFVSAFMASLRGGNSLVREISVRRPGLAHLMHHVEKTGALPTADIPPIRAAVEAETC